MEGSTLEEAGNIMTGINTGNIPENSATLDKRNDDLIGKIYESAIDPSGWLVLIESIALGALPQVTANQDHSGELASLVASLSTLPTWQLE